MKLEELLGAELFAQVQAKLDEVNGKEPDKLKHVRYADLSEGEYVGRGKHEALQNKYDSQAQELASANELIAELKKGTKGNEELQGKITTYEGQIQQLQEQLQETKIKSAIKVALLSEKALDVDYLTFKLESKLKEEGKTLQLDDTDSIKGWKDLLSSLKTQFPNQFENAGDGSGSYQVLDPQRLERGDNNEKTPTKDEFRAMTYEQRVALKKKNEELYKQLSK